MGHIKVPRGIFILKGEINMAEILSEFGHLVGLVGGNNIQATTMPTYSSVPLGTIVQYIGTTTADYINGYFYKATATGWEQHDTQPASNADNSITAFKESSPAQTAHAVDEYIRYNNVTYIVTAAIAIGDTLTIGTNIAVPTLDEGTVIYTPETGGSINGVIDVLVDGQSVVDENGEAHINTPNAGGIGYDNTASELEATNTQDAIDEVVEGLDNKVDKVTGKGLSANDYTDTDKAKVGKIDETTTSASGNPISITGLKSNQLAKDPIITLEPIQAGSGDPSPSNVRAISGYDKIEVLSCGKNLCRMTLKNLKTINTVGTWSGNSYTIGNVTYTVLLNNNGDVSGINVNGTCNGISEFYLQTPVYSTPSQLGLELNTAYKFTNNSTVAFKYDSGGNWDYPVATTQEVSFTFTDNIYSYRPILQVQNGVTVNNVIAYPMCRDANIIDNTYEPYHKTTDLSLQISQTVYGGTLDVRTGKLTNLLGLYTMETKAAFNQSDTHKYVLYYPTGIKSVSGATDDCIFECLPFVSGVGDYFGYYHDSNMIVICVPDNYTIEEFNVNIAGSKFTYPLATPYTIQLTPHEISLLKDYAYVSTNGTNMQFSYKNGEMASLGDVAQLGETLNALGDVTSPKGYYLAGSIPLDENFTIMHDGILIITANPNSAVTYWDAKMLTGFSVSGTTYYDNTVTIPVFKGMIVKVVQAVGTGAAVVYAFDY